MLTLEHRKGAAPPAGCAVRFGGPSLVAPIASLLLGFTVRGNRLLTTAACPLRSRRRTAIGPCSQCMSLQVQSKAVDWLAWGISVKRHHKVVPRKGVFVDAYPEKSRI